MPQIAEFEQANNPYRSSASHSLDVLDGAFPATQEFELRAFVGRKADYYLRKWAPRLNDSSAEAGMNWAAFFLTAFWLAYRKMYRATFIFYAVVIALAILQQVVFVGLLGSEAVPPVVGAVVNLMTAIVCGFFGNAWYLTHTQRAIATARSQGLEDEHLLFVLAQRGGTSLLAAFGLVFLGFVLIALLVLGLIVAATIGLLPR